MRAPIQSSPNRRAATALTLDACGTSTFLAPPARGNTGAISFIGSPGTGATRVVTVVTMRGRSYMARRRYDERPLSAAGPIFISIAIVGIAFAFLSVLYGMMALAAFLAR